MVYVFRLVAQLLQASVSRSATFGELSALVQTPRRNNPDPDMAVPQGYSQVFSEADLITMDFEAAAPVGDGWFPARTPTVGPLTNIEWLHVPKTGTSFIATILTYTCGQEKMIDLDVSPHFSLSCTSCYDFALKERYPWNNGYEHCQAGVMSSNFHQKEHGPVSESTVSNTNVVTMFRRPSQRIISAFHHGMHSTGFSPEANLDKRNTCAGNISAFARFPGIAGCATRMLSNLTCAQDPSEFVGDFDGGKSLVSAAKGTLEKLAFVGLMEEWDESICLFHVMFGGRPYAKEFKNMHPGSFEHPNGYDESDLDGWVDEADEMIYEAAKKRFDRLKADHCDGSTSCCHLLFGTENPKPTNDLSCSKEGFQCGSHEAIDCGHCAANRLVFMDDSVSHPEVACDSRGKCHSADVDVPSRFFEVNTFDETAFISS